MWPQGYFKLIWPSSFLNSTGGWEFGSNVWLGLIGIVHLYTTLWSTYKKLWKITIFHGKTHYFNGHFPAYKLLTLPEGIASKEIECWHWTQILIRWFIHIFSVTPGKSTVNDPVFKAIPLVVSLIFQPKTRVNMWKFAGDLNQVESPTPVEQCEL